MSKENDFDYELAATEAILGPYSRMAERFVSKFKLFKRLGLDDEGDQAILFSEVTTRIVRAEISVEEERSRDYGFLAFDFTREFHEKKAIELRLMMPRLEQAQDNLAGEYYSGGGQNKVRAISLAVGTLMAGIGHGVLTRNRGIDEWANTWRSRIQAA